MTLRVLTNLSSSIGNEELTLCWLLEIALPDGTFKRFSTLGSIDVTIGGDTFYGFPGFDFSSASFSVGNIATAIDVTQPAGDGGEVTFAEAVSGIVDGAAAKLWLCDWVAGTRDRIGSIYYVTVIKTSDDGISEFSLTSASKRKRHFFAKRFSPGCKHLLGDSGCGFNLASLTQSVTVASSSDLTTLVVSGLTGSPADGYFALGAIKFTSGVNSGISYEVRKFTSSGSIVELATPMKYAPSAADALDIHPGCDKTVGAAGCARYSNFINRLAFDHLPDETLTVRQIIQAPNGGGNNNSGGRGGGYYRGGGWRYSGPRF